MDLLARREHSRYELEQKLRRYAPVSTLSAIDAVLDLLEAEQLLSDTRFADMVTRHCIRKGYGPTYIRQKLSQQHVTNGLIDAALHKSGVDWLVLAEQQRAKHFGASVPSEEKKQYKQIQYLLRRGFLTEHIQLLL